MNKYYTAKDLVKGKKNRLKVGQKVKAKLSLAKYYVQHVVESYGVHMEGHSGKEIREQDLPEIYAWIGAHISKTVPVGVVKHYGCEETGADNKQTGRKFVAVEFIFNTGLGPFEYGTYVSEKDLAAVKTKVRK